MSISTVYLCPDLGLVPRLSPTLARRAWERGYTDPLLKGSIFLKRGLGTRLAAYSHVNLICEFFSAHINVRIHTEM